MKKILFFLILTLLSQISFSQYLPLRIYSSSDGLASNQVLHITEDKKGALWIGCGSGLSRFNGFKFNNFGLKEGLPDISIIKILPTQTGSVFVLTFQGLSFKNEKEDYFKKVPIEGEITDFTALCNTEKQEKIKIYACVKNQGIFEYRPDKNICTPIGFEKIKPETITEKNGNLITANQSGEIFLIDLNTKKIKKIANLNMPVKLKTYSKNTVFAIGEKNVFSITFNKDTPKTKEIFSSKDKTLIIFDALKSGENEFWIGTNKSLIKLQNGIKKVFTTENGIPELPVFAIFKSSDGTLWIGTNSGLAKLVNAHMLIYKKVAGDDIQSCISLYWDKEKKEIWTGTNRGVYIIKGENTSKLNNEYLNQYVVWDIEKDDKNNYYFATEGGGILKLSPNGKQTIFKKENNSLPYNKVTDLLYANNSLYAATKNGFAVYKKGKWKIYTLANGLPASYIRALAKDDNGNIYLATYGAGIVKYKNGQFSQIIQNLRNEFTITYAVRYQDGKIWAACNYGLIKVENGIATLYDSKNGFPNYSTIAILPLKRYIWVGTDRGTCLFDAKKEKVIQIFTIDEGLPGDEFTTHNAICMDNQNNIWIGTFGGIAKINQKAILESKEKFNPKIFLENITYFYKGRKTKIYPSNKLAILPYGAKDITLNFDIIWFRNEYSISIFYKLMGESPEWKKIDNLKNTTINFNFLSYGEYDLYMKIINYSGHKESIEKKILKLKVKKPWWAKIGFIFLALLLFIVGGGLITLLIVHIRTTKLKKEKEYLDKLVAEKTEQLRIANEKLKEKNELLKEMAEKDFLTGLYNRRHAMKVLRLFQKLADREPNYNISFILIDIDFFKIINDTYGHDAGDYVLKELAKLLEENTRKADIVARWGGEEFLIILPKTNLEGAKKTAEKLRKIVEEKTFNYKGDIIRLTISAGVASLDLTKDGSNRDIENLLIDVDKKLYQAKQSGRNLIVY